MSCAKNPSASRGCYTSPDGCATSCACAAFQCWMARPPLCLWWYKTKWTSVISARRCWRKVFISTRSCAPPPPKTCCVSPVPPRTPSARWNVSWIRSSTWPSASKSSSSSPVLAHTAYRPSRLSLRDRPCPERGNESLRLRDLLLNANRTGQEIQKRQRNPNYRKAEQRKQQPASHELVPNDLGHRFSSNVPEPKS